LTQNLGSVQFSDFGPQTPKHIQHKVEEGCTETPEKNRFCESPLAPRDSQHKVEESCGETPEKKRVGESPVFRPLTDFGPQTPQHIQHQVEEGSWETQDQNRFCESPPACRRLCESPLAQTPEEACRRQHKLEEACGETPEKKRVSESPVSRPVTDFGPQTPQHIQHKLEEGCGETPEKKRVCASPVLVSVKHPIVINRDVSPEEMKTSEKAPEKLIIASGSTATNTKSNQVAPMPTVIFTAPDNMHRDTDQRPSSTSCFKIMSFAYSNMFSCKVMFV
jgi:hypothetical protein